MSIRKKILVFIIAVVAVTGIIVYVIILPTINEIKGISQAIYNERVDLEKKYLRGQLLKKTLEDFEKIKPKKNQIISAFLILGKELDFIKTLETTAGNNKVTQNIQLNVNDSKKKEGFEEIPITLTIQGNFVQTMDYLHDLEKLNYYINLSSLKISAAERASADQNNLITTILSGKVNALNIDKDID